MGILALIFKSSVDIGKITLVVTDIFTNTFNKALFIPYSTTSVLKFVDTSPIRDIFTGILGPILAIIISFIPSYVVTYYGGKIGYLMGNKYLSKLYTEGLMDKVMYICSIVGLMVIGSMMASMIGIVTPLTFNETLVLQDVLNGIVPQIIPLSLTFLLYWLIKKKVATGWILSICIFGGILLSTLGIFQ